MEKRGREERGRKRRLLKGGRDTLLALVWSTPLNVQLSQESAPMPRISHLCEYTGQICAPLVLPTTETFSCRICQMRCLMPSPLKMFPKLWDSTNVLF